MLEPNVTYAPSAHSAEVLESHSEQVLKAAALVDDILINLFVFSATLVLTAQLLGLKLPYGRYSRKGWGPLVPARAAWVVQESPSLLVPAATLLLAGGHHSMPWTARITAAAFFSHYLHRVLIYPLRMPRDKRAPLLTAALAFVFTSLNGLMQASMWLRHWRGAGRPPLQWALGMLLWLVGAAINIHADHHLLDLRQAFGGYQVPRAGLFRLVTAPNYAGEILEWCGYAVACNHPAAGAFALWTACMLAPRAAMHHADYRRRFGWQYPYSRKVLVPWVW